MIYGRWNRGSEVSQSAEWTTCLEQPDVLSHSQGPNPETQTNKRRTQSPVRAVPHFLYQGDNPFPLSSKPYASVRVLDRSKKRREDGEVSIFFIQAWTQDSGEKQEDEHEEPVLWAFFSHPIWLLKGMLRYFSRKEERNCTF